MRTLKLTLQYDGTDYVGWQRQATGRSIQGLLEDALGRFDGAPVTVHGAGRTDAGVHAHGQVATVALQASIETPTLTRALNAILPPDVRVLEILDVAPSFHARFSATGKLYEYRIVNAPIVPPFMHRYVWQVLPALSVGAMRRAAEPLAGTHDFAAFQGAGSAVESTVRTVRTLDWRPPGGPGDPLVFQIEGDGFLRHMVRNIVGTLVEVGLGRRAPDDVRTILESRDRTQAGPTAPARGLHLIRVFY